MFAWIVGPIDWNGAFVLASIFIGTAVVATTVIVNRRSRAEIHNEFELGKMKLKFEDDERERITRKGLEIALAEIGTKREIEFKRIDSGMIDLQATQPAE